MERGDDRAHETPGDVNSIAQHGGHQWVLKVPPTLASAGT